ncbi:MAG: hypothetical protein JKX70_03415 [Phycisphaerales bacterium]|nr:hypothetical protein [Phycisphaerales bacterium]
MKRRLYSTISVISMTGLTGLAGMSLFGTGCVSYTNVPVPASAPAFKNANHMQSISVVTRALEAVIAEHEVVGDYAINLPVGTTPETFDKIIAKLPAGATMPFDGMSTDMPTYHIGRVWIRASDAKVDVIYPFTGLDGITTDQNVTVWLSGGVRRWKAYRQQHWTAGTIPTPPVYVPAWNDDAQPEIQSSEMVDEMIQEDQPAIVTEPTAQPKPNIDEHNEAGNGYREVPVEN